MIVVTGGAGFIGSAFIWKLNQSSIREILVVDDLDHGEKWKNLRSRRFADIVGIEKFITEIEKFNPSSIIHMGACSSTTETNVDFLMENNYRYSQKLFDFCRVKDIPFLYASSAATYGLGNLGFSDDESTIHAMQPINAYGYSKSLFDSWVMDQKSRPSAWAGFKFFNVYGPNEYHKGSQASVAFHGYKQATLGAIKLFKSYKEGVAHGEQRRDFVYVKDAVNILWHFLNRSDSETSGIYNVGTGQAKTFLDLGHAVFNALDQPPNIEWIEMPEQLKRQYQYFTCAELNNLRNAGYMDEITELKDGVADYVRNYLASDDPYL